MDKDFDYDKLRSRSGIAEQENFNDYREGLPTTISLVVVDQDLKILSKAEESFLVGSVNEAERNHRVNSDDSASRKYPVYESLMRNGRLSSVETDQKMRHNGGGKKVNRTRGNLQIQVIDDTAIIQFTSIASGSGYGRGKTKQRTNEKRDKRTQRKEKGGKQGLEANGKGKNVFQIVEVPKNSERGTKKIYSRHEMEVLRFINPEEQRKMWMVVCCNLGPVVLKEYDGLANCENQKPNRVNFDHRRQFAKKEEAPAFLGMFSFCHFCVHYQSLIKILV